MVVPVSLCLWIPDLLLYWNYDCDGLGGYAFAAAGEAEVFGGGGFYAYAVDVDAEVCGNVCPHGIDVGTHLGCLRYNRHVDVAGPETFVGE